MKSKKFGDKIVVRIDKGEDVLSILKKVCEDNSIRAGTVQGIGALSKAEIGLIDLKTKQYKTRKLEGIYEVTSLLGNITIMNDEVRLHIHITLSDDDCNTMGGHLFMGEVGVTCEVIITEMDADIGRKLDAELGVNLLDF
ncbi:MAG: hypothetical protein ACD_51C00203G0006 [uncultured bacterium]|nr:MAG: hypothetical protein ACD_51C00203G0006 [uncultured bacterium]OGJ48110.1 MAG: hypothetical protein A2244_01315 [Candidatus Peregrinibacteria bacterium RIFOXYA2_FULL_41_18]OGJ49013.1 MAG: hypothetical protein A2344_00560 [Candidatus Peregrinibacteria bacterium RIFOXYB12_FULL_41_12]OGJ53226.1 MAG: hypothetical protein A2448_04845 [Candidatus Peregrinibacteria bacterium RIFOXYC2_FULL_41_22]OGJ54236.1 MAG: hypothetical protein A2336_02030 [Candidatus Peregrinibacteria bacterium RIFOXYB2_FULL